MTRIAIGSDELAVVSIPLPRAEHHVLSEAEREVAALAARGLSNAEIAAARGTALRTVANQIASILRKLGVGSRRGLTAWMASAETVRPATNDE